MIDFERLKYLRIKKDHLIIVLEEREKAKRKSLIYFGVFILAIMIMTFVQGAFDNSQITETELNAARLILKLGGIFFWAGIYLTYRVFSLRKEIKHLKEEFQELAQEIQYLSN